MVSLITLIYFSEAFCLANSSFLGQIYWTHGSQRSEDLKVRGRLYFGFVIKEYNSLRGKCEWHQSDERFRCEIIKFRTSWFDFRSEISCDSALSYLIKFRSARKYKSFKKVRSHHRTEGTWRRWWPGRGTRGSPSTAPTTAQPRCSRRSRGGRPGSGSRRSCGCRSPLPRRIFEDQEKEADWEYGMQVWNPLVYPHLWGKIKENTLPHRASTPYIIRMRESAAHLNSVTPSQNVLCQT